MTKPLSMDLRERAMARLDAGETVRAVAQALPTFGVSGLTSWILPWITIALFPASVLARVVRVNLQDTMSRPFATTGFAKGLIRPAVLLREALPNIAIPYMTTFGAQFTLMIIGAIVVERVFGLNGVGAFFIDAIRQIQKEDGIAVILITHDIGALSVLADRVAVLYAGQVAEEGSAVDVLTAPVHPYTRGLLASVPDFRSDSASGTKEIRGAPPNQAQLQSGCRFAERCDRMQPRCHTHRPRLQTVGTGPVPHRVACPVVIAAEGIATHD